MADLSLDGRKVLVVEDEFLLADDLSHSLQAAGAIVLGPARSGAAALEIIESEPQVDGALLDVNLGGEKVFPVAEALEARHVPFCFTTGYDSGSIPSRFASATRFEKPLSTEMVARAMGDRLRRGAYLRSAQ
jgi:CheY-like chemotaxis protein